MRQLARRKPAGPLVVGAINDQVRARIRAWLETSELTQTGLGKALGHGQTWVSRYLAGELEIDFDKAAQIAAVFGQPVSALFDTIPDPNEAKLIAIYRGYPPALRNAVMGTLEAFHRQLGRKSKPR